MKTKFIFDTSIIIDQKITEMIELNKIKEGNEIIIPIPVLDELQSQASQDKEHGFIGLNELEKITEFCRKKNIQIRFEGERPNLNEIILSKKGRIDAIINEIAKKEGAILVTGDYVQSLTAKIQGIETIFIKKDFYNHLSLEFEKFFTENTMSLHLKEGCFAMAKIGKPGNFQLENVSKEKISGDYIKKILRQIENTTKNHEETLVEINLNIAIVIQYGSYRITITKPPFSDKIEITIIKPIAFLKLEEYGLSENLKKRLDREAEGIVIAGAPGSGKSTFASALAEFYVNKCKIVKTFESPRDLHVPDEVTQYAPLNGSFEKAVDLLLLVRPDYTIFDEIRRTRDFVVFSDMRLAGVGMIGVIHASSPIDAIQRFIGKIELGMIPHILDTIIFIKNGEIYKTYEIKLTVKVPTGMMEQDLARPLVEIRDFESGNLEYEIYTYGEENVVVPILELQKINTINKDNSVTKLAESKIKEVIKRFDAKAEIKIISNNRVQIKVDKDVVPRIIGRGGATISELEEILGIKIDIEPKTHALGEPIDFKISESGSAIILLLERQEIGSNVDIYIEDSFLMSSQIGKKMRIKIDKRSDNGKKLINAILGELKIMVYKTKL